MDRGKTNGASGNTTVNRGATHRSADRFGILIQARMSSRRLPGKVLRSLGDRPVIQHVWERCQRVSGADLVCVITSSEKSDDSLDDWARAHGANVFRGPLDDVAQRFVLAANEFALDAFVRINADSPLLDPHLIAHGISLYRGSNADLVTNVLRRTYPAGMSVEVLRRQRYEQAFRQMESADDREHVTRYYYRNPETFVIKGFEAHQNFGDKSLAIDTAEDFARIEKLMTVMREQQIEDDWESICSLADTLGILPARGHVTS